MPLLPSIERLLSAVAWIFQRGQMCAWSRANPSQRFSKPGPIPFVNRLAEMLCEHSVQPALSVILGTRLARQGIPAALALPSFLQNYLANLVTAAVRLIPLGQTDGQPAIVEFEESVLAASAQAENATIDNSAPPRSWSIWPPWCMKRNTRGSFAHDSRCHPELANPR